MSSIAQVNGALIPEPMVHRGRYVWTPPEIVGRNGRGDAIVAPFATVSWKWQWLTLADYTYWVYTVLAGAASLQCTIGTILVNHLQQPVVVQCVVLRPTYGHIAAGLYRDVELKIEQIVEDYTVGGAGHWLGGGYPPTYSGE